MPKLTGGEALVHSLIAHDVDTLFALPGVQNDYFFNALYDERDHIRVIHTRHEQGAAYMALGYALSSAKTGVYNVVPGPGFLNTTAALATAYARNAHLLCLTGQIRSDQIGRGFGILHEIPDQLAIIRSLTKWAARIESPGQAPALLGEAFHQMRSGRPRPVGLECPLDVLAAQGEVNLSPSPLPIRLPLVDLDAVDAAAKLLGAARNPLIFIGSGAVDAGPELLCLAEALQAPIIASYNGRGIVSDRHYLSHTYPAGHRLWPTTDVVLAVGTRLQVPIMNWGTDDELKIIRIDIDPQEHIRYGPPAVSILAPCRPALAALIPALEKYNRARSPRRAELEALKADLAAQFAGLSPQMEFLQVIREEVPDDGFLVEEMTQVSYVARFAFPVYLPKTFVTTGYQGTLGWGFATALGVKVANPTKPVISLCGDGGFMFAVQELATAVQHHIGVVILLFDDGAYGNVQRMQKELYGNRVIASDLRNPDFVQLASAFGAQALRAETPAALRLALRQGMATTDAPTLIEIPVGEMPSPWPFAFFPRVRPVRS